MRIPDSLYSLVDHGIIEEVVRPLMSGKEAQVYLVVSGGEQRVAKIYKEAQNRTFQNRADYTEGRKVRNSRDQRAMSKGSRHGRAQNEAAWRSTEVDMIYRLRQAGVRVPEPYHFIDGVLIMELVTDAEGFPAPRLGDLTWEPADAVAVYQQLLAEAVRMLSAGVVHGDLSDFNVLMSADGPVIIDLPQAVDASSNQNARKLLLRDVDNLHRFLAKYAPGEAALPYAQEMWELYKRNALTPDTRLSGRYRQAHKAADTDAVMGLIADAARDDRRRREQHGLTMRGAASASIADQAEPVRSRSHGSQGAQSARPARGGAGPARPRVEQGDPKQGRPLDEVRAQRGGGPLAGTGRNHPRDERRPQQAGGRSHAGQRPPHQQAPAAHDGGRFGAGQREPRQQVAPARGNERFGTGPREPRQQARSAHDREARPAGLESPRQDGRGPQDRGRHSGGRDEGRRQQAGTAQPQRALHQDSGGAGRAGHEARPPQGGGLRTEGRTASRQERPGYDPGPRGPRQRVERPREASVPRQDVGASERVAAGSRERRQEPERSQEPARREHSHEAGRAPRERTSAAPGERVVHGFGERVARAREDSSRPADGGQRPGEHPQGRSSQGTRAAESDPPRQRGDGGTGA